MKTIFLDRLQLPPDDFTGICILKNGDKIYKVNGKDHRFNGPAIEYADGTLEWRLNDMTHRLGGPAYIPKFGATEYFINGVQTTKEEHDLLFHIMKLKELLQC